MRSPVTKVREQFFLAGGLGTQFQNLLLPAQFHGQSSSDEVGRCGRKIAVEIFGIVAEHQGVAGLVKFEKFFLKGSGANRFAVGKIFDAAFEEGIIGEEVEDAKGGATYGEDVHGAVVFTFEDFQDFRGAAETSEPFG